MQVRQRERELQEKDKITEEVQKHWFFDAVRAKVSKKI